MNVSSYGKLRPYHAPTWMETLKCVPPNKVHLAMTPTPIHEWNVPGIPQDIELYIKRDDMTGSTLSGNKVRKLEFLFGHILQHGYTNVITLGGFTSNHCRATAIVAAQFGIKCHLMQRSNSDQIEAATGNLFLSRMCDASYYLVPGDSEYVRDFNPRMKALSKAIFEKRGEKTYQMPAGGSDLVGIFGYLDAWREMVDQGIQERFDDVVVACGTGGTIAGLAIGNYVTGGKLNIHGITIHFSAAFLHRHVNQMISEMELSGVKSEDMVDIIEGYIGGGYGKSTDEDHSLYKTIVTETGIFCDHNYVGKGVKGLISELNWNPSRFKGKRILFIHTGGIFGMYEGRMFDMFSDEKVHDWRDIEKAPQEFL